MFDSHLHAILESTVSTNSKHAPVKVASNSNSAHSLRKIQIPFYHTKTPAEEQQQYYTSFHQTWREDIIACMLRTRNNSLGQSDVKVLRSP